MSVAIVSAFQLRYKEAAEVLRHLTEICHSAIYFNSRYKDKVQFEINQPLTGDARCSKFIKLSIDQDRSCKLRKFHVRLLSR